MKVTIETKPLSKQKAIIIGAILGAVLFISFGLIYKFYYYDYWRAVETGEVRANSRSRIYHLPHCRSYNRVGKKNLRTFNTVAYAESKRYRPAESCPSGVVEYRKEYEKQFPSWLKADKKK